MTTYDIVSARARNVNVHASIGNWLCDQGHGLLKDKSRAERAERLVRDQYFGAAFGFFDFVLPEIKEIFDRDPQGPRLTQAATWVKAAFDKNDETCYQQYMALPEIAKIETKYNHIRDYLGHHDVRKGLIRDITEAVIWYDRFKHNDQTQTQLEAPKPVVCDKDTVAYILKQIDTLEDDFDGDCTYEDVIDLIKGLV